MECLHNFSIYMRTGGKHRKLNMKLAYVTHQTSAIIIPHLCLKKLVINSLAPCALNYFMRNSKRSKIEAIPNTFLELHDHRTPKQTNKYE